MTKEKILTVVSKKSITGDDAVKQAVSAAKRLKEKAEELTDISIDLINSTLCITASGDDATEKDLSDGREVALSTIRGALDAVMDIADQAADECVGHYAKILPGRSEGFDA